MWSGVGECSAGWGASVAGAEKGAAAETGAAMAARVKVNEGAGTWRTVRNTWSSILSPPFLFRHVGVSRSKDSRFGFL